MSRRSLLERYNEKLNIVEEIHPKEARDDANALRMLIKGKRDVALVNLNKQHIKKLEKYKLGAIPIRMTSQNTMMSIVYRDEKKANRLYEIAKSKGGYLNDKNSDEAWKIGKLLGYSSQSINEYVQRKYGSKTPIRTDTADDYNDLDEQQESSGLNKKMMGISKDAKGNKVKIFAVNGSYIKGKLKFMAFVEGGHHYVDSYPEYKKYIPEDEIWVDDVFLNKPNDFRAIVGHEWLERNLMKYNGWSYEKAHEYSNKKEMKVREGAQKQIAKEKLQEGKQYKRIIDLMNRLKIFYFIFLL
jgi:hypothetical protein